MSEKVNFFMTEISNPSDQIRVLENASLGLCRIEISFPHSEEKMVTSFIDGWSSLDKTWQFKIPESWKTSVLLNTNLKATVFTNDQLFGLIFKISSLKSGSAFCVYPEKFFKINRREAFRYKIPGAYELKIDFYDNSLNKKLNLKIMDISADGLGLTLPPELESHFKPGQIISGVNFKLNNKEITVEAEVRAIFKVKENNKELIKMGIKFKKFSHFAQGYITSYINTQVSQYSKKML